MNYLKEKNEIPGYGHHTLTHLDSRFLHLKSFIEKHIKQDPLVSLAQKCYKIVPGIFKTMKNVQNPYPTVDALSGVLLNYYGFKEVEFYLLLNTVARSMGCMSNIIITKALSNIFLELYLFSI